MKNPPDTYKTVYNFKTKHKGGFLRSEVEQLLQNYPNIEMDKFADALTGVTCEVVGEESLFYPNDIEKALRCAIEKRGLHTFEMD